MHTLSFFRALIAGWASIAHAQQFGALARQSYEAMGLSNRCVKVLNETMEECDPLLFHHTDRTASTSVGVLPLKELKAICQPKCRDELAALRVKIVDTCTSPEDVIHHSGTKYPPFFFLDKFAYTFDINCYKDKSSGDFCDEIRSKWSDGSLKVDKCHECFLGPLATMVASPLGFSEARLDLFTKFKAACKDAEYEPKVAKSYAKLEEKKELKVASAHEKHDANAKCARWYTMQKSDTCGDISRSQKTSTVDMIQKNSMDINCAAMPEPGTKLCLNKPCTIHTIVPGDTCASISKKYSITESQFRSMNEMIDDKCSNIARWEGYVACVGPKSLFAGSSKSGNYPEFSGSQIKSAIPVVTRKPLAPGSSSKCNLFVNGRALTDPDLVELWGKDESLMSSDNIKLLNRCDYVAGLSNIYIGDFKRLNPSLVEVAMDKTKERGRCYLEDKYSYCLAEDGGPKPDLPNGWNMRRALRWG